MESDEEDIKPGFAGSPVSSRSPSPILDHFHPQSPQQQQHAAPNETQEQPCRPLLPRQRKKQANFDVAQGEDQVFVAGSTSTRRKGRAARADSDTDFDADNQDDDGLDDDEDEEEESDGESSEEETLDTASRRQGRAKKQQAVKGMWSAESVLPEEEFGSKTVIEIYTMIKQGIINLNPDYQRGAVWPQPHSQGLIASLFQNMHVPHLLFNVYTPEPNEADEYYVPIPPSEQIDPRGVASVPKTVMDRGKGKGKERAEEGDGWISREVWSCADGKQRMTAIVRFIDGEFPAIAENKKKYLYSKLDPAAKQVFDNKRLRYGYFRELSDRQEREIFRRVQLGKALDKGEQLASIDAPYADWVRELQAQFFNSSDRNSMRPRILALGRGRALVAAYQASYNIRICVQHDSLDAVKCQSDTARSKELSSNKVPNAQIKAIVQQILERFHRLTLIDPLEGEDEWPNTKAGKKMKAAGLKVPHRVWRLSTAEIGSGGTKGKGGKKATSSSSADSVIAFAPVEMYLLPALVWHMEKEFDYLGDGRLLEIIELARIFLHTKFRKVMKDNTGVTEAFKQWCNDFNADMITDKYRDDGTLRSQKRKKKRSRPDDDSASATPSVAPSTSTASTSKAKPADAASLAAAAAPLQSGSGKKKRPAATEAASTSSATKGKGKGKATSATTSTSKAANPRSDAFLPPPAAPPAPPARSTPSASTTSNQISPGGAVMPFGSPSQKSKSSFPSAPSSAAATVDANAGTVVIPSQPHTRGLNAPQPSQQAALSAKQAKFAGLVGNAGVPPPPPPTAHTGGPRQQPSIATSQAQSQAIRGLPSSKKRGREEPVKRDERGRPIVTPVAVGGENGYGPLSAGGQDMGMGLGGMSMGELGMMDYEALDADQRQRERMERETQNALNGARNGGRAGGGGGGRYDGQHNQNLGTSVNGNEPVLKRVKREPGVEPSSSGGYAPDDRDEDEAMRERREREKDEETFAILRQRNGGGGGRHSRENSRDPGGGRARYEDDRHAPPRRYEDDRYGLPPRGRYEDHGRGFGGGSGGRNDERYGRESNGDWDRDRRRRASGESRSSSSLSRLPPNLQTVAGLPPRPTTSIGASNGYNDRDNAANASGQRGIPLGQQNALRPPTMDPRKRKN